MIGHVHSRLIACAAVLVCAATPVAGVAAGLGFLRNTPLSYFTDEDMKLMREAAQAVLADTSSEASREWKNPKTGYSGQIRSLGKYTSSDGLECRRLKLGTQAKGIENEQTLAVCQASDGEWRIASGKQLEKT